MGAEETTEEYITGSFIGHNSLKAWKIEQEKITNEREKKKVKSPKNRDKKSKSPINEASKSPIKNVGVSKKQNDKQDKINKSPTRPSTVQSRSVSRSNSPIKPKSPKVRKIN